MLRLQVSVHDASASAGAARRPVRLTRRGRAVLLVVATVVLFAAFSIGRVTSGAATPTRYRAVVVAPGQTLWSLASELSPDSDPRVTVARLEAANHLTGAGLVAGQRLLVPIEGS